MGRMNSNNTRAKYKDNSFSPGPSELRQAENPVIRWIKARLVNIILVAALVVGLMLLIYPSFADYWNSIHQARSVMSYAENVANMNEEEYAAILDGARTYNKRLAESGIAWGLTDEQKKDYLSQLDVGGDGIMGYIKIRKINITLPIYHGTDDTVLQTSIGHLEETSLPVGGESSHCVLSGHRGLPSARLFTDLDKLVAGDTFTITVLNETLTYEVDHIWVVEPEDLSHLMIENGKDYCTLVTCTPYGVNTHRLLVRGHRVENAKSDVKVAADAVQVDTDTVAWIVAGVLIAIWFIASMIRAARRKKRQS